jgi:hypothetical protein
MSRSRSFSCGSLPFGKSSDAGNNREGYSEVEPKGILAAASEEPLLRGSVYYAEGKTYRGTQKALGPDLHAGQK